MTKSLICPHCGCIGRVPDYMEKILKEQGTCEMCGSSCYIFDGEVDPFMFPGQFKPEKEDINNS